jgi:hypothetical protein
MPTEILSNKEIAEIKEVIKNLPVERKLEILTLLEEDLFALRFKALLEEFRSSARQYPLTLEEITQEVESTRQERYESGN